VNEPDLPFPIMPAGEDEQEVLLVEDQVMIAVALYATRTGVAETDTVVVVVEGAGTGAALGTALPLPLPHAAMPETADSNAKLMPKNTLAFIVV